MRKLIVLIVILCLVIIPTFALNHPSQFWSQRVSTYSDSAISWNSNKLDKTYCTELPGQENTKFYDSNVNDNVKGFIDRSGCWTTSYAMLFKNLGAQTVKKYVDLRKNYVIEDYMEPDPFSVVWVNMHANYSPAIVHENNIVKVKGFKGKYAPTSIYHDHLAKNFGYRVKEVDLENLTNAEKIDVIDSYLRDHPEGVMIRTKKNNYRHTLVFAKSLIQGPFITNSKNDNVVEKYNLQERFIQPHEVGIQGEAPDFSNFSIPEKNSVKTMIGSEFLVCDPYTKNESSLGDNVEFSRSFTYYFYNGYDNIYKLQYLVPIP
ncbi:hypothetical protein IMX26_10120 [Clostridium sp. 'deep sea']|uniref:hypothetical protein n=1 Tax=Clostridium sp. 'deep sea' TaxID=2779445 RepID=UPI0018966270|nr:hypothetical protein [Clostridium sp. 'deep sea']QOR33854.1 hypothetical protein IMX26_10120 [Clostridium sp. 'deep sea']